MWYNGSIDGVGLAEVNIIGFIGIGFGFELWKSDVVYRYLNYVGLIGSVMIQIGNYEIDILKLGLMIVSEYFFSVDVMQDIGFDVLMID